MYTSDTQQFKGRSMLDITIITDIIAGISLITKQTFLRNAIL